ncbi:MAG: serpin family protein, partial [Planctomycetota bacterium]
PAPPGAEPATAYLLRVASGLFAQEGLALAKDCLQAIARDHDAPLERVDFRSAGRARERINHWVAERTAGKIPELLPPNLPRPDTRLALANAVAFQANWQHPFPESATQEAPFHAPGSVLTVPFLRRVGRYAYAEADGVRLLEVPYRDFHTSFVVLLPAQPDGLDGLERGLDAATLDRWLAALKRRTVDLRLPRLRFRAPLDLVPILQGLGVRCAFDPSRADFGALRPENDLFVGSVLHQAFIAVDEKGTEASAATVVLMQPRGLPPKPEAPLPFVADRPFLFLIRHRTTNTVLFLGRVLRPQG